MAYNNWVWRALPFFTIISEVTLRSCTVVLGKLLKVMSISNGKPRICTPQLPNRFFGNHKNWYVISRSVLDPRCEILLRSIHGGRSCESLMSFWFWFFFLIFFSFFLTSFTGLQAELLNRFWWMMAQTTCSLERRCLWGHVDKWP
jgi:hypothetical protein